MDRTQLVKELTDIARMHLTAGIPFPMAANAQASAVSEYMLANAATDTGGKPLLSIVQCHDCQLFNVLESCTGCTECKHAVCPACHAKHYAQPGHAPGKIIIIRDEETGQQA